MRRRMIDRRQLIAGAGALASTPAWAAKPQVTAQDLVLTTVGGRLVRSKLWRPATPKGLLLFSHGAMSGPDKYPDMLNAWAAAGWVVAAPMHVDSPQHPDHAAYNQTADWRARLEDMALLADTLSQGFDGYVIAGHSAGGLVANVIAGAKTIGGGERRDPRVKAAITFSPPGALPGFITAQGYRSISAPLFVESGDQDVSLLPGAGPDWRYHFEAFEAVPATGNNYSLALKGVDHFFGGLICWTRPGPPQTAQLREAVRISTDFLQAFGAADAAARGRLDASLSDQWPTQLARR